MHSTPLFVNLDRGGHHPGKSKAYHCKLRLPCVPPEPRPCNSLAFMSPAVRVNPPGKQQVQVPTADKPDLPIPSDFDGTETDPRTLESRGTIPSTSRDTTSCRTSVQFRSLSRIVQFLTDHLSPGSPRRALHVVQLPEIKYPSLECQTIESLRLFYVQFHH